MIKAAQKPLCLVIAAFILCTIALGPYSGGESFAAEKRGDFITSDFPFFCMPLPAVAPSDACAVRTLATPRLLHGFFAFFDAEKHLPAKGCFSRFGLIIYHGFWLFAATALLLRMPVIWKLSKDGEK